MKFVVLLLIVIVSSGCSTADISKFTLDTPQLSLIDYFTGKTVGVGIVQDRSGKLTRQFVVDITGRMDTDGNLVLEEFFDWNDGEKTERIWTIKIDQDSYIGTAADVVGHATGTSSGNGLNWRYTMQLPVEETTWKINFDDWMFLQPNDILINRARMSKFGIHLGDVTIVFYKNRPVVR